MLRSFRLLELTLNEKFSCLFFFPMYLWYRTFALFTRIGDTFLYELDLKNTLWFSTLLLSSLVPRTCSPLTFMVFLPHLWHVIISSSSFFVMDSLASSVYIVHTRMSLHISTLCVLQTAPVCFASITTRRSWSGRTIRYVRVLCRTSALGAVSLMFTYNSTISCTWHHVFP
jgi:hypothetical protein